MGGHVVGVPVRTVRSESQHDLRAEGVDLRGSVARQVLDVVEHAAVREPGNAEMRDADDAARIPKLGLADPGQGIGRGEGRVGDLAAVTAGGGQQRDLHAPGGQSGQRAGGRERLVVGVGEDREEAAVGRRQRPISSFGRKRSADQVSSIETWVTACQPAFLADSQPVSRLMSVFTPELFFG